MVNGARGKTNFDFIEPVFSKKRWKQIKNNLSSIHNDWNRRSQYDGQATLANKVNGTRDKTNFDFELVCPKNVGNK